MTKAEHEAQELFGLKKNDVVSKLSKEIILAEPVLYSKWVAYQFWTGVFRTAVDFRQTLWLLLDFNAATLAEGS